jgi:hypothetical protein
MEERNVVRYVCFQIRNLLKNCEIKIFSFERSRDNLANVKARELVSRTGCNLAIRYDN